MAHNDFPILKELLRAIDDKRNDIFLHIDIKSKGWDKTEFTSVVKFSNLFFVPSTDVRWGGYSQVHCELRLIEAAINHSESYTYLHLLTGATYPLKNQDYMHDFFNKNQGYEFIGISPADFSQRVQYDYLFNEMGKPNTFLKRRALTIRRIFLGIQKTFHWRRKYSNGIVVKKGLVYWSLTQAAATYLLAKEDFIHKLCKDGLCNDEVFAQTTLWDSPFREKIFNVEDEYESCQRITPWGFSDESHRENFFHETDYNFLKQSGKLFALKFGGDEGLRLIKMINGVSESA